MKKNGTAVTVRKNATLHDTPACFGSQKDLHQKQRVYTHRIGPLNAFKTHPIENSIMVRRALGRRAANIAHRHLGTIYALDHVLMNSFFQVCTFAVAVELRHHAERVWPRRGPLRPPEVVRGSSQSHLYLFINILSLGEQGIALRPWRRPFSHPGHFSGCCTQHFPPKMILIAKKYF